MDNKHCQTRPQTAVMPFIYFNEYTPVIPKFYYDVYSLEEREKHIAKIIQKLMCYSDYLAQSLDDEIDNRAQEETRLQECSYHWHKRRLDSIFHAFFRQQLQRFVW